jgi:hypothetical protein
MNSGISTQVSNAIGAHGAWKLRLKTAITTGRSDITPEKAACDNECAFGKWLYGDELDAGTKAGLPFQVVKRLHGEFHHSAGSVLALALGGRTADAQALLNGDYTERSDKLVRALSKWKRELI